MLDAQLRKLVQCLPWSGVFVIVFDIALNNHKWIIFITSTGFIPLNPHEY